MKGGESTGVLAPPATPWSGWVTVSFIIHVAGFGLAIGLPRLLPHSAGPPSVYVVDLVSLPVSVAGAPPPGGSVAPAAPAPVPSKPEKTIKIPEPAAKKTQPKKPPGKPATTPSPAPKPEAAAAKTPAEAGTVATTTPGQATGTVAGGSGPPADRPGVAGGTGSGGTDARTFYYSLLDRKIRGAWKKPLDPENLAARSNLACLVTLSLSSSGRVLALDLERTSGFEPLDRSALRAVQDAEPFPPFPYQLGVSTLTIKLEFVLTP